MNTDELVKQIRTVVREEVTAEIEPVKKDLQDVKQSQGNLATKQETAQVHTALEALAAGQKDQATKADIHRLEQKIDK